MPWIRSHRADPPAREIADRHYSRQKPGSPQFVKPGSCFVLRTASALWVTSAPIAAYVKHEWAGAWECSTFRNEGGELSSELVREAVALTLGHYGAPPALGMVTFVDPRAVPGFFVRASEWAAYYPDGRRAVVSERDAQLLRRIATEEGLEVELRREHYTELRWGYSFWKAGFEFCGWTKGGLYALQLLPEDMPEPLRLENAQRSLFAA